MDRSELSRLLAKALAFKDAGNYTQADKHAQQLVEALRKEGFNV